MSWINSGQQPCASSSQIQYRSVDITSGDSVWALDVGELPSEQTLCSSCQSFRMAKPDKDGLVHTDTQSLTSTAEQGCGICRILQTSIKGFATNILKRSRKDRHGLLRLDLKRSHSLSIRADVKPVFMSITCKEPGPDPNVNRIDFYPPIDIEIYAITRLYPRYSTWFIPG